MNEAELEALFEEWWSEAKHHIGDRLKEIIAHKAFVAGYNLGKKEV